MYSSIGIKNFRGLQDLSMDDLGRVNLIVGPNNIGKTSLLEALWLFNAPGNPMLIRNVVGFRGFDPVPILPELLWHGLFHNMSLDDQIEVEGKEINGAQHSLLITLSKGGAVRITPESTESALAQEGGTISLEQSVERETLKYQYLVNDELKSEATASFVGNVIEFHQTLGLSRPSSIFLSARRGTNAAGLADRFTKVKDSGKLDSVVRSLQVLEPSLQEISLGYVAGGPVIRGHLAGLSRPLPLPILGGGVVRLTEILLAVFTANNGLVLIDEIEDGIYHRSLDATWKAIDLASGDTGAQIIATTHSQECVQAVLAAFASDHTEDFRLHRLERKKDKIRAVTYDHETAAAALDMNLEVR